MESVYAKLLIESDCRNINVTEKYYKLTSILDDIKDIDQSDARARLIYMKAVISDDSAKMILGRSY